MAPISCIVILLLSCTLFQTVVGHEEAIKACSLGDNKGNAEIQNSNKFWSDVEGEQFVVKLNDDNFYNFTQDRTWIFFYNTWCSTFKSQKHSVAKIAVLLNEINYPGGLGAYECLGLTKDNPICDKYQTRCRYYNMYFYGGKYVESYPYGTEGDEPRVVNYFMKRHIDKPDTKVFPNSRC